MLEPAGVAEWLGAPLASSTRCIRDWDDLPPDDYLKDGGRYRQPPPCLLHRSTATRCTQAPHRAHWQPVEYNALHGGMQRWFAPMEAAHAWRSPPGSS